MSGNTPVGRPLAFDPSLLNPIVRTKRTTIACTECRKRQVKCSGGSPRCERCKKKGFECTYVPLAEQRAAESGSPRPSTPSSAHAHAHGSHHGGSGLAHGHAAYVQGGQGQEYASSTGYTVPQNWNGATQYAQASTQYASMQPAYQQGYPQQQQQQQDALAQEMYAQAYAQGGYDAAAMGGAYTDAQYFQMGGVSGDQQSYGQYAAQQQAYVQHPVTGQMIPAELVAQWASSSNFNPGYQGQQYPSQN